MTDEVVKVVLQFRWRRKEKKLESILGKRSPTATDPEPEDLSPHQRRRMATDKQEEKTASVELDQVTSMDACVTLTVNDKEETSDINDTKRIATEDSVPLKRIRLTLTAEGRVFVTALYTIVTSRQCHPKNGFLVAPTLNKTPSTR